MLSRPDLVHSIEVMDGEYFVPSSLAQFCFRVISAADAEGHSLTVDGEVFYDSIHINGHGDVERSDDYGNAYSDDVTARRVVAANLFGYEEPARTGVEQPALFSRDRSVGQDR